MEPYETYSVDVVDDGQSGRDVESGSKITVHFRFSRFYDNIESTLMLEDIARVHLIIIHENDQIRNVLQQFSLVVTSIDIEGKMLRRVDAGHRCLYLHSDVPTRTHPEIYYKGESFE